ncbi:MAG: hypothetical protein V4665_01760 [Patescibacteria group bacterium]
MKKEMLIKTEGTDEKPLEEGKVEAKEVNDPFKVGRERMALMGNFFTKMKEKAVQATNYAGAKLSRFFSRAKTFGGEAVAATLSVDVLTKKGAAFVGEKVVQADEWTTKKAGQAGEYLGKKGAEVYSKVEGKADQAEDWVVKKGEQFEQYVEGKADQAEDWVAEKGKQFAGFVGSNYEKAINFTSEKANQLQKFTETKIELAKDIAFLVEEKTMEGFVKAQLGLENRFNQLRAYSENAWASAQLRFAEAKKRYRENMNAIRMRRIQASIEKMTQRGGEVKPEQVYTLQGQLNSLMEKMNLLQTVETVAA